MNSIFIETIYYHVKAPLSNIMIYATFSPGYAYNKVYR